MSRRNQTGEWIKLGRDLWTHPKVRRIADILGGRWQPELPLAEAFTTGQIRTTVLVHAVVSGLSRLFLTVNRHASEAGDGTLDAVLTDMTTDDYLDEVSGLPGMQAAMIAVGWAAHDKAAAVIRLPNYLEHNALNKGGKRAGTRGNSESPEAKRKREARARTKAGQLPDNPPGQAPDKTGQSADNSTEQSRAELKTHVEKKVLSGGQAAGAAGTSNGSRTELQKRVDALRPESWGTVTHWSAEDLAAYNRVEPHLAQMAPHGWKLLAWYFRWCGEPWNVNNHPEECRVTGNRARFLDNIADYHARAGRRWSAEKRPALEPKAKVLEVKPTAPEAGNETEPPLTPAEFRAAVMGGNAGDLATQPAPRDSGINL